MSGPGMSERGMSDGDGVRQVGFLVRGRVQGVGFRWWTRQTAAELGLSGSVKNLRDGSVEVHVKGPGDRVASFRQRLEEGPTSARVESVTETESSLPVPAGRFEIAR